MNNNTLTDTQRRALLRAEVQKLQGSGMAYDSAFQTAVQAHPEWRTVEPLGHQNRQRRNGAQLANANGGDAERSAEIQRLIVAYQRDNPRASYDTAFAAVLRDPKNKTLAESLHKPQRAFGLIQRNTTAKGATPASKYPQGGTTKSQIENPGERAPRLSQ